MIAGRLNAARWGEEMGELGCAARFKKEKERRWFEAVRPEEEEKEEEREKTNSMFRERKSEIEKRQIWCVRVCSEKYGGERA